MKTLRLFLFLSCFALVFSLTSCTGETKKEEPETKTEEPKPEEKKTMTVDSAAVLVDSLAKTVVDSTANKE